MGRVEIGKVSEQQQSRKGWLVGQFFPDGNPFQDNNVEIYYKKFPKGDQTDRLHKHPHGKECLIVLQGKMKYRVGDEVLELETGDYVAVLGDTPDKIEEVIEDLTIIGVRYPSIPDNKVFLE